MNTEHMTKPILTLQNISCETLGNLEELFLNDGFVIEKVNTTEERVPKDPTQYSSIIILGGPMSVYENSSFINDQISLVQVARKKKIPVLGICLGSQIIAQSSGGRVFKGPRKEIGWYQIVIESTGSKDLFSGISSSRPKVFQWHGDSYSLPQKAIVLARSEIYPQAFAMDSLIGIQFHLEVTEKMIRSWIRNYKSEVISEKVNVQRILKESATQIEELEKYCTVVYSNFCTKFSL